MFGIPPRHWYSCHRQVISYCWWMKGYNLTSLDAALVMDSLYGHCITVRQAPFRCVGLWAKHWAMEMLSPRSSPEGGLSLPRKSSLHICVTVSHGRNHQQTSWLCEEGPLVQWERPIWESFLEAVTLELILEGQVWITLIYSIRE